jgi:hypothetical protein
MYEELTIENSHMDYIQLNHYMDEGCICEACNIKRTTVAIQLLNGKAVTDHIHHSEAVKEMNKKWLIHKKIVNETNGKNFKTDMNNVVNINKSYY